MLKERVFLVGGCVRDTLMNKPINDKDYVVIDSSVEEMKSLGFTQVGKDFPVFLHPETKDEYALARTERKSGKGYNGFVTSINNITLEDDLARRDLTINSIAYNDITKEFIDPYEGLSDIYNKVLRHTTKAFKEDPVRVLRLARFSVKFNDFKIAEETKQLVLDIKKEGLLNELTPERISKELDKVFMMNNSSIFFKTLLELNVLDILFPEIYRMVGAKQKEEYHAEGDVFNHVMMVIDAVDDIDTFLDVDIRDKKVLMKYVALLHDIGKIETQNELGTHHGHDKEELVTSLLENVNKRLKMSKDTFSLVLKTAINHHRIHNYDKMTASKKVKMFNTLKLEHNEKNVLSFKLLLLGAFIDSIGRLILVNKQKTKPIQFISHYRRVVIDLEIYQSITFKNIKESLPKEREDDFAYILSKVQEKRVKTLKST
jgi:tRNA nucleotidyltransferase (CCA-adding enzyme)